MLLGMTSCIYDNVDCPEPAGEVEGPGLSFVIATRAGTVDGVDNGWNSHYEGTAEGFEDYIQINGTKRGMRVLFFSKDGKFRYRVSLGAADVKVVDAGYEITISEKLIRQADHGEEVLRMIKEDGFKIAVLANWPIEQIDAGAGRFEYDDDIGKLSHFHMDESIDDQFDIYSHVLKGGKGNFLSSCNTPWVRDFTEQHGETNDPYWDRIKTGYRRFYYHNINRFIKAAASDNAGGWFTADEENHSITFHRKIDDLNEYSIKETWRLWDFSGGQNDEIYAGSKYASQMKRWSAEFVEKYKQAGTLQANGSYQYRSGQRVPTGTSDAETIDGLLFYTGTGTQLARFVPYDQRNPNQSGFLEYRTVPTLAEGVSTDAKNFQKTGTRITHMIDGTEAIWSGRPAGLGFYIPCDVTVRVTASSPDGAYLYMSWVDQANTSLDVNNPSKLSNRTDWWFVSGFSENPDNNKNLPNGGGGGNPMTAKQRLTTTPQSFELTMNPSNQLFFPVFIFGQTGTLRIHNIEFVKDVHLYDIDSVTQCPDVDNPIPMYGVQDFDPVGDAYDATPTGGTFPISSACEWAEDYDYKKVYLVRSIAKVEIYFPRSIFEHHRPTNVYMRTLNTKANCETVDVRTPTDLLWYGKSSPVLQKYDDPEAKFEELQAHYIDYNRRPYILENGIDDELGNIKNAHIYKDIPDQTTTEYTNGTEYKRRLAWFYGSWRDWKWDWNGSGFQPTTIPYPSVAYPRIFNPRIEGFSNNNYVRFVEVPEPTGQYIKYICYSPEKIPDDTDINGSLGSRAKVEHVELHFGGPQDNIDDNYAYRLYFTDYSKYGSQMSQARDQYDGTVERSTSLLGYIDPVLRNHVYRFYVESFNPGHSITVRMQVVGPTERSAEIEIN